MALDLTTLLATATTVIPLASAIASAVNHAIREKRAAGETVPAWALNVAAALNVLAVNLDKTAQLVKLAKGK